MNPLEGPESEAIERLLSQAAHGQAGKKHYCDRTPHGSCWEHLKESSSYAGINRFRFKGFPLARISGRQTTPGRTEYNA